MRIWLIGILLALLPLTTHADGLNIPLVANYDLEGEATDADQIVTVVNLTNVAMTIAAQPDVCRQVTITIVDTGPSIIAGTTTVVGTDCNGDAQTEILDGSGGAGTITSTGYFESVASATNAAYNVLDGGADETITMGVAALDDNCYEYCRMERNRSRRLLIETAAGGSTTTTGVTASDDVFKNLSVGDFIGVNLPDDPDTAEDGVAWRHITAKASDDSLTVNSAWDLSGQHVFFYRLRNCGAGDQDGWINMLGADQVTFHLDIQQMSGTGGITYVVECRPSGVPGINPVVVIGETNVAAAVDTSASVVTEPWSACRLGFRWETNDDAVDTTTNMEQVYAGAVVRR